jgi:dTDP-4-dehydrorhamnose reductase
MRVTVLGAAGMLGHVVARYLAEAGHSVQTPAHRFDPESPSGFLESLRATHPEAVVNCIGIRAGSTHPALVDTHVRLVERALECLKESRARFIQASTDGVFRPDLPARRTGEPGDATDDYGKTKWEAELRVRSAGGLVIRCSILGPELRAAAPRSLMGWFLTQRGPVRGFVNHAWNGITTLQWAMVCHGLLEARSPEAVCQPGFGPPIHKAEVLRLIGDTWDWPIEICPEAAPQPVLRTLAPDVICPSLKSQLEELRDWYTPRFASTPLTAN